jgi:hypothetical protein
VRLLGLTALLAFRALTALVLAMGIGGLVAALVVMPLVSHAEILGSSSIPLAIAAVGLIFLGASIASRVVMPRQADVVRQIPPSPHSLPLGIAVIGIACCVAAVWQVPRLVAWVTGNRAAVEALVGTGPDPLGFSLVPAAVAYALPALTALALVAFAVSAVLVLSSRPELAFRILLSCFLLQAALVLGERFLRADISVAANSLITALQPHGVPTSDVAAWLVDNDGAARAFEWRLVAMLGATFAALILTRGSTATTAVPEAPAPVDVRVEAQSPPIAPAPPPRAEPSPAVRSPFDQSNYSIRPRLSWWNPFVRRCPEYDIASIPPMSSTRCVFSWDTGQLRRARDGAVLLTIAPPDAPGLFLNRSYAVSDGTRGPLGTLEPAGADWTIRYASGDREVYVLRGRSGVGFARFVASRDERELCRFTWTIEATVVSAELEIEFMPDADPALRTLAIALAPILELRSRLRSERKNA